jgi:hypothetical protein
VVLPILEPPTFVVETEIGSDASSALLGALIK